LKSTETTSQARSGRESASDFSNFGSLKSTETDGQALGTGIVHSFSNFGSLKSTETAASRRRMYQTAAFQQFRLVEEH